MAYCISNTLAGIATDCQSNLGGVKVVYIANYADDIFTLDASGNTVTGISSASTWYQYNFRQESSNFTSTLNKAAEGSNYVSTEIVLSFSRMETSKRIELNALALNEIAVVVVDNNGEYHCFGIDRPVSSSTGAGESGTAFGDANRYTITLLATDGKFAPMMTPEGKEALKAKVA
ncbi:MAG: hypothetical protein IJH39_04015 [Clostridia bacterium]|nr:hypothetical protein [Clostridia bacterium]